MTARPVRDECTRSLTRSPGHLIRGEDRFGRGVLDACSQAAGVPQDDIDTGRAGGLSTDERAERVRPRRENGVQAMEIEILERASAYVAREAFPGPE